ncbi:MAG: hypothetical protein H0V11_07260 [Actinobacteria bacterium]|nr:hypothetical protein [Actinomycetota bacterium]
MDSRAERIGTNETLFREINERLEGLNQSFSELTDKIEFVCECGLGTCIERFSMDVADYEKLRGDPTTFAVKPGHEILDVEDVVDEHGHYVVVRKKAGEAAALAVAEDPRS